MLGSSLVTERLPDVCKTLHPITSTTKKKKISTKLQTMDAYLESGDWVDRGAHGDRGQSLTNGQSTSTAPADS